MLFSYKTAASVSLSCCQFNYKSMLLYKIVFYVIEFCVVMDFIGPCIYNILCTHMHLKYISNMLVHLPCTFRGIPMQKHATSKGCAFWGKCL